jgi:uncharacterized protein (DUF4213/DUF364 family)
VTTIEALLAELKGDAPVRQVLVGAFWTAVVLDGDPPRCGLASTLHAEHHDQGPAVRQPGHLCDLSARDLAEWLHGPRILEASIGMAAFNALLDVDEVACTELNAEELILERGAGRRVAIVGHFPFVERVRRAAKDCWVLELNPHPGDLAAALASEILPQADVVALTGTSLLNHTFDDLVALCRPDAFVTVLGASAPLSPVLFDRGVSAVAGTKVVDVQSVLAAVREGATFRQIPGKRLLTMFRKKKPAPRKPA